MTMRLVSCVAAVICGALLLCISRPHVHTTAYAGSKDDDVWQGTVTVVDKIDYDDDKTDGYPGVQAPRGTLAPPSLRHLLGYSLPAHHRDPVGGYGACEPLRQWEFLHTGRYDVQLPPGKGEEGFESTTSGATVAQGEVSFFRNRNDEDSRKAECRIEVDAQEDWRDRPELTVWTVGRSWRKPADPKHKPDSPQKTRATLAPTFVGIDFHCDPDATSYSGAQQIKMNPDATSMRGVTWNIHRGPQPETEIKLIPPKGYDKWLPQADEDEETLGNYIDVRILAHKKGDPDADPLRKVVKYKIELEDTSHEKGGA